MDKALKSLLIGVEDETYLRAKCYKFGGYVTVTTKELLEHLQTSEANSNYKEKNYCNKKSEYQDNTTEKK